MNIFKNGALLKPLSYFLGLVIAVLVWQILEATWKIKELEREQKQIIERVNIAYQKTLDNNILEQSRIINSLEEKIQELKKNKDEIIKDLPSYEKNPVYDIDFIAAFRIISESDYKQRESNGNARQREND